MRVACILSFCCYCLFFSLAIELSYVGELPLSSPLVAMVKGKEAVFELCAIGLGKTDEEKKTGGLGVCHGGA